MKVTSDVLEEAYIAFQRADSAAFEANEARLSAEDALRAEDEKIRRAADPDDSPKDIDKAVRKGTKALRANLAKAEREARVAQNQNRQASIKVDMLVRLMEAEKLDVYEKALEKGLLKVMAEG